MRDDHGWSNDGEWRDYDFGYASRTGYVRNRPVIDQFTFGTSTVVCLSGCPIQMRTVAGEFPESSLTVPLGNRDVVSWVGFSQTGNPPDGWDSE
jgi:hypothetical protein